MDFRAGSIGYILVDARKNGRGRPHWSERWPKPEVLADRIAVEHQNQEAAVLDSLPATAR